MSSLAFEESGGMGLGCLQELDNTPKHLLPENQEAKRLLECSLNMRTEKCWKMLESAACALGWINPLLGQMAPSPCRADKPQSAHHPACICVFVCANKKKAALASYSGKDGGWVCFGLGL